MNFNDMHASLPIKQILSPYFRTIATVRFFRSGNSPIFPPICWYESLMISVERERRAWRRGVEGSSEAIMSFGRLTKSFADDVAHWFTRAALFRAFTFVFLIFSSSFIFWFWAINLHWVSTDAVTYILAEGSGLILMPSSYLSLFGILTIILFLISISSALISWMGRIVLCWKVS